MAVPDGHIETSETRHIPAVQDISPKIVSGAEAVLSALARSHDAVVVCSETLSHGVAITLSDSHKFSWITDPVRALAYGSGLASTGVSVGVFLDSSRTAGVHDVLESAACRHFPLTIVLSDPLSVTSDAASIGNRDMLKQAIDAGCPVLCAASSQEAADLTLVAAAISSSAMTPVVVFASGRDALWSLQEVERSSFSPDIEISDSPLGAYRKMLFGPASSTRTSWIDPSQPMEIGASVTEAVALKRQVGRHGFVRAGLNDLADQLFTAFAEQTGRSYARFSMDQTSGASTVLVATGSIVQPLRAIARKLRAAGTSVEVLHITQLQPFPSRELQHVFKGRKRIGVCISSLETDLDNIRLVREVKASVLNALTEVSDTETRKKRKKHSGSGPPLVFPILHPDSWNPNERAIKTLCTRLNDEKLETTLVIGVDLSAKGIRYPEIERLRQQMTTAGIDFAKHEVESEMASDEQDDPGIYLVTASARQTWRLLSAFSNLVAAAGADDVRASFHVASDATTHPVIGRVTWQDAGNVRPFVFALGSELFGALPLRAAIPARSEVFIVDESPADAAYASIARYPYWMTGRELQVHCIEGNDLEIPAIPGELVSDWALIAAGLNAHPLFQSVELDQLTDSGVLPTFSSSDLRSFLDAVRDHTSVAPPESFESAKGRAPEPETPAAVEEEGPDKYPVADLNRFWKTTGILYREGRLHEVPVDAFLTSGVLPARSGALTQQLTGLKPLPHVITELCTGCGACWTVCPESAFSASLFTLEMLFDAAVASVESSGTTFLHVTRLRSALVKTMHRLAGKDDLHQLATAGDLLLEASRQVIEKTGFDDEKRATFEQEVGELSEHVADVRPVRTDRYFFRPDAEKKGSGGFLGLTIDPFACTTCGLCISSCKDQALEQTQTAASAIQVQSEWHQIVDLRLQTPPPDVAFSHGTYEQAPSILIGRSTERVFRAGGADIGNVNRTVLRLFLEAAHVQSAKRSQKLIEKLETTIGLIDARMQDEVRSAVEINDFEAFASSLKNVSNELDQTALTHLASETGKGKQARELDDLARLAELRERLTVWLETLRPSGDGPRPAHMILVHAMSERSFGLAGYPINPFAMPCLTIATDGAADLVEGISDGLAGPYGDLLRTIKETEQVLQGVFDPLGDPTTDDPSFAEEIAALAPVVLLATDRFGMEELRLISQGKPFKILVMTGARAMKGATQNPFYTTRLALSVENAFVRQTSAADPVALLEAFLEALAYDGSSFLHVYAPDPARDGIQVDGSLELCKIAMLSRVFPDVRRAPGSPLDLSHNESGSGERPTAGDWMLAQERFSELFEYIPRRDWSSEQISLNEWQLLPEADRAAREVYVERRRTGGPTTRVRLAPEALEFASACSKAWDVYLSLSEISVSSSTDALKKFADPGLARQPDVGETSAEACNVETVNPVETLTSRLLALSGFQGSNVPISDWESSAETGGNDTDETV